MSPMVTAMQQYKSSGYWETLESLDLSYKMMRSSDIIFNITYEYSDVGKALNRKNKISKILNEKLHK